MVKKTKNNQEANTFPEEQPSVAPDNGDQDIKELLSKLEAREKEAKENYDKYLRAVADLENYRKRAAKEKADAIKFGQENLIKDILPQLDSLELALGHAETSENFEAFKKGLHLVREQLLGCLYRHGVERIEACGREFDPNVHEAMLQVESEKHGANKVVDEFQSGYTLHGRLLRPAKVSVSKTPKREEPDENNRIDQKEDQNG